METSSSSKGTSATFRNQLGKNSFQEISITKFVRKLLKQTNAPSALKQAAQIGKTHKDQGASA